MEDGLGSVCCVWGLRNLFLGAGSIFSEFFRLSGVSEFWKFANFQVRDWNKPRFCVYETFLRAQTIVSARKCSSFQSQRFPSTTIGENDYCFDSVNPAKVTILPRSLR